MAIDKFDPNLVLININKLKPYRFQDTTASKGLESIVERGRDRINIEMGFHTTPLENTQGIGKKNHFQSIEPKSKSHDLEPKSKIL
jgi:hypothetical protein